MSRSAFLPPSCNSCGILILAGLAWLGAVPAVLAGAVLVDGREVPGEVLFEHPNAPLLVLRSENHRGAQTLPLAIVHSYEKEGQRVEVKPRRALDQQESLEIERNRLWLDEEDGRRVGAYAKQVWEKKPLLVWAKPGVSDDYALPENWLDENGQPLRESPWQTEQTDRASGGRLSPETEAADGIYFDGDVLLPAADDPYEILQAGERVLSCVRHMTVERNAYYRVPYTIVGNLWVKDGGRIRPPGGISRLGSGSYRGPSIAREPRHTVLRFADRTMIYEEKWFYAQPIGHYVWIDPTEEGSVEIIGWTGGAIDRIDFVRGTTVISEDSFVGNGNRAAAFVHPEATLILLDGARFGHHSRLQGGSGRNRMATYGIGGTLLFGTPELPLTRDLEFSAAFYPPELVDPGGTPSQRAFGASFVLGDAGRMVVHSSDPTKHRVMFVPRPVDAPVSQYDVPGELWPLTPRTKHHGEALALSPDPLLWADPRLPNGLAAIFRGQTDFNGVHFDFFYEGGIMVDPAARAQWKNVTFGPNNHAPPEKLFRDLKAD